MSLDISTKGLSEDTQERKEVALAAIESLKNLSLSIPDELYNTIDECESGINISDQVNISYDDGCQDIIINVKDLPEHVTHVRVRLSR